MSEKKRATVSIYKATNTVTGVCAHIAARGATEACKKLGWEIGDTYITAVEPRFASNSRSPTALLYSVPCGVCPFQYAQCVAPTADLCPVSSDSPDLVTWLKNATQAHLCPYVGESLSEKDHKNHIVWLPLESALSLLDRQR